MRLFSLAVQNLKRKPFRTLSLALAVAIASGAVFSTAAVMWGVERSLDRGFSRFGADLLVVPQGTLVGMRTALLTGEPSTFYMDGAIAERVRALSGVAKASPQVFLTTAEGDHCIIGDAFLVGFDPQSDFTVLPWLRERMERDMRPYDVIVGGRSEYDIGQTVYFYGEYFTVYGRLERTGMGLYDNAVFMRIDKAYDLAEASKRFTDAPPLAFDESQISALLVQIRPTANVDAVQFAIAQHPGARIITAGNVVTSVRQNLVALFSGTVFLTAVFIAGNVLMLSAIFSTIVNERKRELGLLRAIGARRRTLFGLVLSEAALLTTAGGVLGVAVGALVLRVYERTIVFHLESMSIPFLWPAVLEIAVMAGIGIVLALLVGLTGAAWPARTASVMEPYDAIRAGE